MKDLLQKEPVKFALELADIYFSKRVARSAAELAYFLILTFFPILICLNAFIGLLHVDINTLMEAAAPFFPKETVSILADYVSYITTNQSSGLLAAGVVMTLFSSSAAFRALMNIMGEIYERKSYRGVWQIVASVVVYRMSAPRGKPRPPLLTGAVLSSAALVAASALFSWFIGMSSRYSLVYGSLASVIILLVWLYLCGNILILGNVFNCVWYRRKKIRYLKKLREQDAP